MTAPLPARFIRAIGTLALLRVLWPGPCGAHYHHSAEVEAGRSLILHDPDVGGPWGANVGRWPTACARCAAAVPPAAIHAIARVTLYDTASGQAEPGDLFEAPWLHEADCQWENCNGRHQVAVLPNGSHWHLHGRASNCDQPGDRLHRCWVVHGDPPAIHVDKAGLTCGAGAGSVIAGDWHGFLHHGHFVTC